MCLWWPGGTEDETKNIFKTFQSVYPHTSIWGGVNGWGMYILGTLEPLTREEADRRIDKLFENPRVGKDLSELDKVCATAQQMKDLYLWNEKGTAEITKDAQLITDDRPYTEFPLWRILAHGRPEWRPHNTPAPAKEAAPSKQ